MLRAENDYKEGRRGLGMPTLESNLRKGCLLLDMIRRKFSGYGEASTLSVRHLYSRIGWINLIQGSEWANKRKIVRSIASDMIDLISHYGLRYVVTRAKRKVNIIQSF